MKKSIVIVLTFCTLVAVLASSFAFIPSAKAESAVNITISEGYCRGILSKTMVSNLKRSFANPNNWNWYIYPEDATDKYDYYTSSSTEYIGTGCTFRIERSYNNVESYDIVVLGDVNGDGIIDHIDYTMLKMHIKQSGGITLSGCYLKAADLNDDGNITATDYLRLKRHLSGLYNIEDRTYESDPTVSAPTENEAEKPWHTGWYS